MISPKEALKIILGSAKEPSVVKVGLGDALGCVLAEDVKASINVPPFNNSAMDGFAVHADDTDTGKPLKIVGEVQAGQISKTAVKNGEAISIMTGAPIPAGTGAVVPIENASLVSSPPRGEGQGEGERFAIIKKVKSGANIRLAGEDIKKGAIVIKAGTLLKPIHLGLAASVGASQLKVYSKPKVAIVVTGDEIIKPGNPLKPGQIYESNSFLLKGLLQKIGADLVYSAKAKDTLAATVKTLSKALERADIVLTTGGISVGKYDLIAAALEKMGAKRHFGTVSQKPGKPLSVFSIQLSAISYQHSAISKIPPSPLAGEGRGEGEKIVVSLPGNPVAVGVCFELYVRPLLLKTAGFNEIFRPKITAELTKPLKKKKGRTSYIRVNIENKNAKFYAHSTGPQGSGVLTSLQSDGIAILPAEAEEIKQGQEIKVIVLEGEYN